MMIRFNDAYIGTRGRWVKHGFNSCQGSEWGVSITFLKYNVIKPPLPLLLSSINRMSISGSWASLLSHFVSIHRHHLCEYELFGLYLHPSIHSRPCWEEGNGSYLLPFSHAPWVSRALNMTRLVKMRYYIAVTLHAMASQITGNSNIKSLLRLTTKKHQIPHYLLFASPCSKDLRIDVD